MARFTQHDIDFNPSIGHAERRALAPYFWAWYRFHEGDKVVSLKLPIIGSVKTVRVRDLRFLFVAIFGAPEVMT